jgi:hypothetical protein
MILFFENTWLLWWAIAFVAVIRFSHFFIEGVRSRNHHSRQNATPSTRNPSFFSEAKVPTFITGH